MKNKKIMVISTGILLSLSMTACQNQAQSTKTQETKTSVQSSNSQASSSSQPAASTQTSARTESNETEVSNNEWMLMGYLVYKDKSINNLTNTINSIDQDFAKGDLEVSRNSEDSYSLSNQYGSVDVKVNAKDVVVTGDGVTRTSKEDLKKNFAGQISKIKAMVKYISSSSSSNTGAGNWKNGTPSELIGEYTTIKPGTEQGGANAAVIDIRNGKITTWASGMPTFYDSNIKYRKEGNKYIFRFDSTVIGGHVENGKQEQTGNSLTLEKEGDTWRSDYSSDVLYKQSKFTLNENPPAE